MKLFKKVDGLEASEEYYDFSNDLFPVPKEEIPCAVCHEDSLTLRDISWGIRQYSESRYRCNLSFKCTICSHVQTHGVIIPASMYENRIKGNIKLHWDKIKNLVKEN